MRKTKIVCTLGPATESEDVLHRLFAGGMNVARINFSHGSHEQHSKTVQQFKDIRNQTKKPVGLLMDTRGPEIRIKTFADGAAELVQGQRFSLLAKETEGDENRVSITHPGLYKDVSSGDRILLDDGLIELRVVNKKSDEIECEVINGGSLSDNKGINIPGVIINLPYVSERDRADILFAIEKEFDFIAASFVRNASCVRDIRKLLHENGAEEIKIIAKIENREGVENIDEIIRASDGIMVARGDMGVEIPFEELPSIQKSIIRKCYQAGKPVITATQMLDSMIRNPRPTRAEITDVANAIYDGTSAIMLSGETAVGKYPLEAFLTMSRIAEETEKNIDYEHAFRNTNIPVSGNVTNAISHATCSAAHDLRATAIISVTKSGHTAKMVSKYRPSCPIIATTVSEKVFHQLTLSWGVSPVLTDMRDTTDEIFHQAIDRSYSTKLIKDGDLVVITGGVPAGISGTTNTLKAHIVGDVLVRGRGANEFSATGNVTVIRDGSDPASFFNEGDILVIRYSYDDILPLLRNASAIITEEDAEESKSAVVGRALEIPVITNTENAVDILKSGTVVTVDAKAGLVYSGVRKNDQ